MSRRWRDRPRCPPGASADARARQRRGEARRRRHRDAAVDPRCARGYLSDAARDDPRPGHAAAPGVREILRLRAGSVPRITRRSATRRRRDGRGTVSGRGRHGGRLAAARRRRLVRYMLLIYSDERALNETERQECYQESADLAHQIEAAGQYLAACPLPATASGPRVRITRDNRLVPDRA